MTSLDLDGYATLIQDFTLEKLSNLTWLRLDYSGQRITDNALLKLTNLTFLTSLNSKITDESLKFLTKLRTLHFSHGEKITNASVSHLTNLTDLSLSHRSEVNDEALTRLVFLNIRRNRSFCDSDIKNFTNLTRLKAGSCQLSYEGLKNLTKLVDLNIEEGDQFINYISNRYQPAHSPHSFMLLLVNYKQWN